MTDAFAATSRPFEVEDAGHLEAARRIAAAVAHINVERPQGDATFPPYPGYHATFTRRATDSGSARSSR